MSFCQSFNVSTPFPVTESLLCYFVATLANQGLAPLTIKTYLAPVRHTQITRCLPEPRHDSPLPRLHLLQMEVHCVRAECNLPPSCPRLPITPDILRQIGFQWASSASNFDTIMLWAAAVTCFFIFFFGRERLPYLRQLPLTRCQVNIGIPKYRHPGWLFSRKNRHPDAYIYVNIGIQVLIFTVNMGIPLWK